MDKEEISKYLQEKQVEGLDQIAIWQLRIAANMGLTKEQLDLIATSSLNFTNREWIYIALIEQVPVEELASLQSINVKAVFDLIRKRAVEEYRKQNEEIIDSVQRSMEHMCRSNDKIFEMMKKILDDRKKEQNEIEDLKKENGDLKKQLELYKERVKELEKVEQPKSEEPKEGGLFKRLYAKRRQNEEYQEFVILLQNGNFSQEQKEYLIACQEQGERMEVIRSIAFPNFDTDTMERLRKVVNNRKR